MSDPEPKYCLNCNTALGVADSDVVCARCTAEMEHDFDAEPNARFSREGRRIDKGETVEPKTRPNECPRCGMGGTWWHDSAPDVCAQCGASRNVREDLAAYAHHAWAGWMKHLFNLSRRNSDGTVTIPTNLVNRWTRQAYTRYIELPEDEKPSDRKEAEKILQVLVINGIPGANYTEKMLEKLSHTSHTDREALKEKERGQ